MAVILDLSSNDHHPIDYAAVKADGITAVIVKATQGYVYINPYYHQDVLGFQDVGVPVIAYHFANFTDAITEASYFKAVAGNLARVLDSETNSDAAWQNEFLAALGLPANQCMDYGSASTIPRAGINALLWVADYGLKPNFGDCWQYTDTGRVNGIIGDVDLSEWTGSMADFSSLFSIAPSPPPEEPMAVSPVFTFKANQIDVVQVSGGTLWHKWLDSGGPWNNEDVAKAAGLHPEPSFVGVPQVSLFGGQCRITVEDSTTRVWYFAQSANSGTWGVNELN